MRAIQLVIEAFGPYSKRQVVDFTQLGHETVFLITGPTGAGKTSIFDAMVYALYGRASGSDRDQDTLRSHFADEDQQTEVKFRFELKQHIYEVRRTPRQLKRKEKGEGFTEQPPKAELYRIKEGEHELLASKIKEVNESIESMLHLDYEQFRKMIMIPQGEFRRLISENSKEREEILQKIFQTYVYEQMTDRLKEESKELKEAIQEIEYKEVEEINRLDWDEETRHSLTTSAEVMTKLQKDIERDQQQLQDNKEKIENERKDLASAQETFYEKKQLNQLFLRLEKQEKEVSQLDNQKPSIIKLEEEVHAATKANHVKPYEDQVRQREEEEKKQHEQLEQKEKALNEVKIKFEQTKKNYEAALSKEEELESLKLKIQQKKKDYEKVERFKSLQTEEEYLRKSKEEMESSVKALEEQLKQLNERWQSLSKATYNSQGLTKQYYELEGQQKEYGARIDKLHHLIKEEEKIQSMIRTYHQAKNRLERAKEQVESTKSKLKQLEQSKQQNQAVVLANHLHDGEACPVCGSMDHPDKAYTKKDPISDEEINRVSRQVEESEKRLTEEQEYYIKIKSEGQTQRQITDQLAEELKDDLQKDHLSEKSLHEQMQYWQGQYEDLKKEKETLSEKIKQFEVARNEMEQVSQQISELSSSLENARKESSSKRDAWLQVSTKLSQIEEEVSDITTDVKAFKLELNKMENEYSRQQKALQDLANSYQQEKEQKQKLETEVEGHKQFLEEIRRNVAIARESFGKIIKEQGFRSTDDYSDAKMDSEMVDQKQKEVENFYASYQSVMEGYEALKKQLENEEVPDLSYYDDIVKTLERNLQGITERQQVLHLQINEQLRIHKKLQKLLHDKQEKEQRYYYVGELAQLARGDNAYKLSFERYVLSAFLDEIILQANIRLDQMTEHRYQLERSKERAKGGAQSGLDLEVLDHYTGQKRSVKTLSGGEGFKAALSLALGMADVVQAHAGGVQLDTLFIDEGFGTLDEISLEQAIGCLKDLQKGNRMLGIISHVPQLKQEIPAKLQIQPSPKGSVCHFTFH
ncbi:hypothetical protein N780_12125 [Pontibacillus chungwhensis BH030062]|uniref:Nuclease SbcCD subunit C n=1 Tax=Pontibacillus chungwhensis BH030062 TaxID=1385513 RepID=A0A0A2V2L8_9BACI|nr:SbcC/MukB-like Walker B domain-containing protein [Pontibacillus chungwhensis]KGP93293.1 hypothetical protein N780_12125 [Pontibacillus chungwhensis BH030062]